MAGGRKRTVERGERGVKQNESADRGEHRRHRDGAPQFQPSRGDDEAGQGVEQTVEGPVAELAAEGGGVHGWRDASPAPVKPW